MLGAAGQFGIFGTLILAILLGALIAIDGESTWLERREAQDRAMAYIEILWHTKQIRDRHVRVHDELSSLFKKGSDYRVRCT